MSRTVPALQRERATGTRVGKEAKAPTKVLTASASLFTVDFSF